MVDSYRPWQDPIGQGQWEWNGYREKLYSLAMRLKNGHQNRPKVVKNVILRRNWFEVRANEKSKNEIESFLISSRSGRTDISKSSVFEQF